MFIIVIVTMSVSSVISAKQVSFSRILKRVMSEFVNQLWLPVSATNHYRPTHRRTREGAGYLQPLTRAKPLFFGQKLNFRVEASSQN